jgi:hypothetical protein
MRTNLQKLDLQKETDRAMVVLTLGAVALVASLAALLAL